MKAVLEVWHGDKLTFSNTYRSEKAARTAVQSRVKDCLRMGLTVQVDCQPDTDGEWWQFTCSREELGYSIRFKVLGADT